MILVEPKNGTWKDSKFPKVNNLKLCTNTQKRTLPFQFFAAYRTFMLVNLCVYICHKEKYTKCRDCCIVNVCMYLYDDERYHTM
jgi:hypothetical protein